MRFFVINKNLFLTLGDKPYTCDICQKKFALSCNLRAHLKTHEAEYQSSPASLELYRRTLELLGVTEGQDRNSSSSSPIHEADSPTEDEDLGMEDVEEDEPPSASKGDDKETKESDNLSLKDFAKPLAVSAM